MFFFFFFLPASLPKPRVSWLNRSGDWKNPENPNNCACVCFRAVQLSQGGSQQLRSSSILEPSDPSPPPLRGERAAGTRGDQVPQPEAEEEKEEERGEAASLRFLPAS